VRVVVATSLKTPSSRSSIAYSSASSLSPTQAGETWSIPWFQRWPTPARPPRRRSGRGCSRSPLSQGGLDVLPVRLRPDAEGGVDHVGDLALLRVPLCVVSGGWPWRSPRGTAAGGGLRRRPGSVVAVEGDPDEGGVPSRGRSPRRRRSWLTRAWSARCAPRARPDVLEQCSPRTSGRSAPDLNEVTQFPRPSPEVVRERLEDVADRLLFQCLVVVDRPLGDRDVRGLALAPDLALDPARVRLQGVMANISKPPKLVSRVRDPRP
jgi:hypothetical protein